MTKFSDEFVDKVQEHWQQNKGKELGEKVGGIHRKILSVKKYSLDNVAEDFNITESQARRILYVKRRNKNATN
tara:strand:- start:969 stop:1187 length:219 start_codon:yes stop_codon:yes gene_type:complete